MRDLKILVVVVIMALAVYVGVEPYAHSVMHKAPVTPDFDFKDLGEVDLSSASVEEGMQLVTTNCIACHSITSQGLTAPMSNEMLAKAYGVVPPDLSDAGTLYAKNYLAGFLKNPTKASHLPEGRTSAMPGYEWMGDAKIAHMVVYLVDIAPKDISNRQAFESACTRCHEMRYADLLGVDEAAVKKYLGSVPPDLSMYLKSRGYAYVNSFLNQPQVMLEGTAMPRVGLNEKSQNQVLAYMQSISDPNKEERERLGPYFIFYFVILAIVSYMWKRRVWSEVH